MQVKNEYSKLDELVIGHHDGAKALMGFAVTAQLRFKGGHKQDTRMAAIEVARDYYAMKPSQLTRFQKDGASRLSKLSSEDAALSAYEASVQTSNPEFDAFMIHLLGDDHLSGHSLTILCNHSKFDPPRYPLSRMSARFTCSEVAADPEVTIDAVLRWCNLMKPDQGTVGIAPTFENGMERAYPAIFWPYLARFVGMDYDWAFSIAVKQERGIKCVNWLTILDDEYVDELGGRDTLAAAMGDGVTIYDWDGGILIRAGAEPQMGDRNQAIWPKEYVAVNNATKAIRFEAYANRQVQLIAVPEPLDPYEETLNWIRRFDRDT